MGGRKLTSGPCRVIERGDELQLIGPAIEVHLDRAADLRPSRWVDRVRDATWNLDASRELSAVVGGSGRRIWITGWRGATSVVGVGAPDDDPGIARGYAEARFDDRGWDGMQSPSHFWYEQDARTRWARTHVFLPLDARGQPLQLVLGGIGLFDFRWMRVFLNGVPIGIREASGRWRDPGSFDVGPGTLAAEQLRFGGDNVIALQLMGYIARDARLDEADPGQVRLMPLRSQWPAQFEQHLLLGGPDRRLGFHAVGMDVRREGVSGEVAIAVESDDQLLRGELIYCWTASEPVVRRLARLSVTDTAVELLRLDLLAASAPWPAVSDGEQGMPVYLGDTCWAGVEHPAGWAIGTHGRVELRQYPGTHVTPGQPFDGMTTALGVADGSATDARASFLSHISRRMRRTRRDHLAPRTLISAFGSWDYDPATTHGAFSEVVSVEPTESIILDHIEQVRAGRDARIEVETYMLDFWTDPMGDVRVADAVRFPRGLAPVEAAARSIGARLGLWLDSSMAEWTIGLNPLVAGTFTHDPGYGTERPSLCRAAEPYRTLVREGLVYLVEQEQAQTLKFDNLQSTCQRFDHGHLPGVWSTEAIMSAQLEGLRAVDAAVPDTFLMLYWGHRSPWWLLDADTLFEPGFWIEASHPAGSPTLYVRDSVIQGLDQAQRYCVDVPLAGKDSLGVWLSAWKWNSSIGTERWAEAMVMDLCRGSLLVQPWSDHDWLTPMERRQMGDLAGLIRAYPAAFAASRPIGGDPWRDAPYGYVCSDGTRAFVAYFNVTWRDQPLTFELGPAWGLPDRATWQTVRRFPGPAVLVEPPTGDEPNIWLRPFEVTLLEIRPPQEPSADLIPLPTAAWSSSFREPSIELLLDITLDEGATPGQLPIDRLRAARPSSTSAPTAELIRFVCHLRTKLPAAVSRGTAVVWLRFTHDGRPLAIDDAGAHLVATAWLDDAPIPMTAVVRDRTYSVPWQAWRIETGPHLGTHTLHLCVTAALPASTGLEPGGAFVPGS